MSWIMTQGTPENQNTESLESELLIGTLIA